jgi:hypothetical protein
MALNGPGGGANPAVGYNLYNLDNQTTQTLKAPIGPTDPHELLPMANGDYMMIGTALKQLTTPFDGYSTVVDCVVQEVTSQGNLVWSWRASDHVAYSEGVRASAVDYNGQTALDVYHCNSVDVDPATGNVLISMRNASALRLNPRSGRPKKGHKSRPVGDRKHDELTSRSSQTKARPLGVRPRPATRRLRSKADGSVCQRSNGGCRR